MTVLAPTLEAFFTERLMTQRHASPNTVAAYRDAWRLLLRFANNQTGKEPCRLDLADLDAPLIGDFLEHLEHERRNSVRTRNARLAAIRSFFRYAALRHPEHAALIARVLDIPTKRYTRAEVPYLTEPEVDALVAAPDRRTWAGRRDHALIAVAVQTGLAGVGAHRPAQRGRPARHRRPCALLRKGKEDEVHPPPARDRRRAEGLDARAPGHAQRPAVPLPSRNSAQPRRRCMSARQTRFIGRTALPVAWRQEGLPSCPSALVRHGAAAGRG